MANELMNELRVQENHRRFFVNPNDPYGPEINIGGFGFFGRDFTLPAKPTIIGRP